uniref:Lcl C-terminal domain-containing protein n=1 Tax=Candidatus Electronema sp. TaxID=2698783 RepID=UPI004055A790
MTKSIQSAALLPEKEKVIRRTALPFAVLALCCGMSGTDAAAAVCGPGRSLPAGTWLMTAPSCTPVPDGIASQYGGDIPDGAAAYGINWIGYAWDADAVPQQYLQLGANSPLTLGNGNWLYSLNAGTLFLDGTATATVPCSNYGDTDLVGNCFAIDLTPSASDIWQMVGNPFPYTVDWRNVRVASSLDGTTWMQYTPSEAAAPAVNLMAKEFWQYGSSYETKDDATLGSIGALRPQESVWVRIKSGSSSLSAGNFKLLIPKRELNDTGITWGGSYPSGNNSNCTGETIGAQDCSNGPDDADMTGNTDSDGLAGFSYTKLASSGQPLANQAADYATTPWACVKDNVTGLIWEVKTDDGGLHDKDDTYTWYNTDRTANSGGAGEENPSGATCYGYTSGNAATYCNTQAYVNRVKDENLCGFNDWRMPTVKELGSLVNYGRSGPAIDTDYFPNTLSSAVWSGLPDSIGMITAKYVNFACGIFVSDFRTSSYAAHLVRGGQ